MAVGHKALLQVRPLPRPTESIHPLPAASTGSSWRPSADLTRATQPSWTVSSRRRDCCAPRSSSCVNNDVPSASQNARLHLREYEAAVVLSCVAKTMHPTCQKQMGCYEQLQSPFYRAYFFCAALILAQRARCAAAILPRAAAENLGFRRNPSLKVADPPSKDVSALMARSSFSSSRDARARWACNC